MCAVCREEFTSAKKLGEHVKQFHEEKVGNAHKGVDSGLITMLSYTFYQKVSQMGIPILLPIGPVSRATNRSRI